ncbi:hypothetical protein ACFYZ8_34325 [Streptomyces sp. NPDC001668]|uniref:hypothetical protein n=1 Tax=Streptomyces sp. NPDC001668 TaxID=3364598 RepID=UPI0036C80C39
MAIDGEVFIGEVTVGKAALPPDADAQLVVRQLRRALHEVEVRELGPAAAAERFGPFTGSSDSPHMRYVLPLSAGLLERHRDHAELLDLYRTLQLRGPGVNVHVSQLAARD